MTYNNPKAPSSLCSTSAVTPPCFFENLLHSEPVYINGGMTNFLLYCVVASSPVYSERDDEQDREYILMWLVINEIIDNLCVMSELC